MRYDRSIIFLSMLLTSQSALAYLDPSTGSMVISAIVGLFASLALGIKTYWYRLKRIFRRGPSATEKKPENKAE